MYVNKPLIALVRSLVILDHTVFTSQPTEVILTPLPRHVAGTHLSTPEGWKAELTQVPGYTKTVYPLIDGHPSNY